MGDSGLFVSRVVLGVANLSDTINQLPDNAMGRLTRLRGGWALASQEGEPRSNQRKVEKVSKLNSSERVKGGSLPLPLPLI